MPDAVFFRRFFGLEQDAGLQGRRVLWMDVLFLLGWLTLLYPIAVFPVLHGIDVATRSGYSPSWMWFGLHPMLGWIAYAVLLCKAEPGSSPSLTEERATATDSPPLSAVSPPESGRLWASEGQTRQYIGSMLEQHLGRVLGHRATITAYLSGEQRPGWRGVLGILLLAPLILLATVCLAIPAVIFYWRRTSLEWRYARAAGITGSEMLRSLLLITLLAVIPGATLTAALLRRMLGLSHILIARTHDGLALFYCPTPVWVPRLGRVECFPVSKGMVTVISQRAASATISIECPQKTIKVNVALLKSLGLSTRGRSNQEAFRNNLDAIIAEESKELSASIRTEPGDISLNH
jgi:hypothetical protein